MTYHQRQPVPLPYELHRQYRVLPEQERAVAIASGKPRPLPLPKWEAHTEYPCDRGDGVESIARVLVSGRMLDVCLDHLDDMVVQSVILSYAVNVDADGIVEYLRSRPVPERVQ